MSVTGRGTSWAMDVMGWGHHGPRPHAPAVKRIGLCEAGRLKALRDTVNVPVSRISTRS